MDYASIIDHTLLKTDAQKAELTKLCQEAKQYKFASVCVSPLWVNYAAEQLLGTEVAVCTVIGFPQGATPTAVKIFETKNAIENGATEVDMVIPVGLLKSGEDAAVEKDIRGVVNAAKGKAFTKVMDEEKVRVCKLAVKAGADFVKTSTGFSTGGATVHDVVLMRQTVGSHFGIKASGGIGSEKDAAAMVNAGATRIGTSHGIEIVNG